MHRGDAGVGPPRCPPRRDRARRGDHPADDRVHGCDGHPGPRLVPDADAPGIFGQADDIAFWAEQSLRPEARFTTGSILYVDGGTDAAMRTDAQPTAMRR
ncbi:hypothetical protein ACFYNN_33340 [Streptomyces sp. NPDC006978]|uniref:hypothetical protein n=1 Tax=unclassified Streptomyces TaxID=2593676 RepID=UPI002AFFB2CB|nr:hypothetical protein [Streptomyces sp. S584]